MRINVYAEELSPSNRVELVRAESGGQKFVGVKLFLKPSNGPDSAVVFWTFDTKECIGDLKDLFDSASVLFLGASQ